MSRSFGKILGSAILTILWVCCFLFIRPSLVIDFGTIGSTDLTFNFKFAVVLIGLLIIIFYHIFYRSSIETTKLSLTVALTIVWLSLTFFYHYQPQQGTEAQYAAGVDYDGFFGFFDLIGGLAVCILWIRFLADEISLE